MNMQNHQKLQPGANGSSQSAAPTPYEAAFAALVHADAQAFALWKGRVALFAILKALGIRHGDEVILPGFTCVVVANAIRFAGGTPVYVDIAPGGYNIDPSQVEKAITRRTRAVLVQHTFGIPGPLDALQSLAVRHRIALIEDCAHTLGSTYQGRPLGTFGQAAFFSSQWSKPYTTGLGGVAVTCDSHFAQTMRQELARFCQPPPSAALKLRFQYLVYQSLYSPRLYWNAMGGLKALSRLGLFVGSSSQSELTGAMPGDHYWRMPNAVQQAGLKKLANYPRLIEHRHAITRFYDQRLAHLGLPGLDRPEGTVLLRYPLRVANKEVLLEKARQHQVELGSWFETPLHPVALENHVQFGYTLGQCPNAEQAAAQVINLPLHSWVSQAEAARMLEFVWQHAAWLEQESVPVAAGAVAMGAFS